MAYAEVSDIQARMTRTMTQDEASVCEALLEDAAIIIDAYNEDASSDAKNVVSIKMVSRAISDGSSGVPMGATQGSMSALGYSLAYNAIYIFTECALTVILLLIPAVSKAMTRVKSMALGQS